MSESIFRQWEGYSDTGGQIPPADCRREGAATATPYPSRRLLLAFLSGFSAGCATGLLVALWMGGAL